jgi:uncharacterized membrane protein
VYRFHRYFLAYTTKKAFEEDSLANALVFKSNFLEIGNRIGSQKAVYSWSIGHDDAHVTVIEVTLSSYAILWEMQYNKNRYKFEVKMVRHFVALKYDGKGCCQC